MKKKYYTVIAAVVFGIILATFGVLTQFKSEESSKSQNMIYEINTNWRLIRESPNTPGQGTNPDIDSGQGTNPDIDSGQGTNPDSGQGTNPDSGQGINPNSGQNPDIDLSLGKDQENSGGADASLPDGAEAEPTISLPYNGESRPGETIVFLHAVPEDFAGLTMVFYSMESSVRVTLDGEVIYRYGDDDNGLFGKSPGSRINFVDLPGTMGGGDIRIELSSTHENRAAVLGKVLVTQRDTAVLKLIEDNLVNFFCCIVMLITTFVFLILGLICLFTKQNTRGLFWLVVFGLDTSFYYLVSTDVPELLSGAKAVYSMGQYLLLMVMPICVLFYLKTNLEKRLPHGFAVLFVLASINIVVQLVLQFCNIQDLANMEQYTILVFDVVLVVCTGLCIREAVIFGEKAGWFMAVLSLMLLIGESNILMADARYTIQGSVQYSQYILTPVLFLLAAYYVFRIAWDYTAQAKENEQKAMAASEAKGKFLANMSHEIRTPINAVLGMDEMILRESKEPKTREHAMDILTSGQMLLSIINDILDVSKIESGKMEIIPTNYDVSSMIHDLSNMASMRAEKKKLKLHTEVDPQLPCVLYGDDVRIRQVLTNILTNAVKYTPEGDIWFRSSLEQKEGNKAMLYFEVEDTGIGIKEEDLPKLSAEFERIEEDRNRNIEGTGLGMSITTHLLQMMGSSLQVESVYGTGSKFYFRLEQEIVEDRPIGDYEKHIRHLTEDYKYTVGFTAPNAKVLVVDDNAINRKVFLNLLDRTKVQITEAESGEECLRLTKQEHFDIIFLDHMMPHMDGVETLQRLRADGESQCVGVPVIALTANAVSGAKEQYLKLGFDAYLSKPIVSANLEQTLCDFLPQDLLEEADPEDEDASLQEGEAKPNLDELPMVEGLDWNYAWMHLSGMELLKSTIQSFYEQIPSAAGRLADGYQDICQSRDFQAYRIQVHAMKSLAATVGIVPLAGMAKILEDAAKREDEDTIHKMHGVFLAEWNGYQEKLEGVFGIRPAEDKEEVQDPSIICALLEMLSNAMQEMDIDTADEKMAQISAYRYSDEVQKNMEQLKGAVENLDAEQAAQLVQTIIGQLSGQKESE